MKTRYKILTFVILGITFVSTAFGAAYLSPGLHPDERLTTAKYLEPEPSDSAISPAEQILAMEPKVTIVSTSGNNARVLPHGLILDLEKNNIVTFYNNRTAPIKLEGQVEGEQMTTKEKTWRIDFVGPGGYETIQFNRTGYYQYLVRTIEERPDTNGGAVVAYSNETNDLPFHEKLRMAGEILHHSDLPLTSIGMGNNEGLRLGFTPSIFDATPNAEEYYKKRAEQLIPFDVPIIIEGPIQPFFAS